MGVGGGEGRGGGGEGRGWLLAGRELVVFSLTMVCGQALVGLSSGAL